MLCAPAARFAAGVLFSLLAAGGAATETMPGAIARFRFEPLPASGEGDVWPTAKRKTACRPARRRPPRELQDESERGQAAGSFRTHPCCSLAFMKGRTHTV